jgi:phosphoglycerate dehydrogenase-like enzyme
MHVFRVAYTGDFLNERGEYAYGDGGFGLYEGVPYITWRFLTDQAPRAGDAGYWERFYSLVVEPRHLAGVDGLAVLRPAVTRETFAEGAADLVVIGRSGAGYDKIDLAACTEHDVALFNCPSALDHSTASTALMFLLVLAKRLPEQMRVVREGAWQRQAEVMGSELSGRTLGIVGLGRSGRELARLVAPFHMRLLAYSPHAEPEQAAALSVSLVSLETLLREADFVSLHARLTPQNRGLIGAEQLALMKPTAYLVNVARGPLVDETALVDALRRRRIAGAALDVFAHEPLSLDSPLLKLENVVLTPHWSASTRDVWDATGRAISRGMLRAAQGQVPENVVNQEVLERPGFLKKLARYSENAAQADLI